MGDKGKRQDRKRDADRSTRRASEPGVPIPHDSKPLKGLSGDSDYRNGQVIRGGRHARTRLRPVQSSNPSGGRGRSRGTSWIAILIAIIVIAALVWFFFIRDADAVAALLTPLGSAIGTRTIETRRPRN
jgi:hypothetical protein